MRPEDFLRKRKIVQLVKAVKDRSPKPGQSLTLAQNRGQAPIISGGGSSNRPKDGFPVGTVRNGRQKVSANPSRWVEVSSGRAYDSHEHQAHEHHTVDSHDELSTIKKETMDKVKNHLMSDDIPKAEKMLEKFLQKRLDYKNMMAAGNVESSRTGGIPKDYHQRAFSLKDEGDKLKDEFVKFVAQSKKRAKDGGQEKN